ncbi:GT-D fold domain-containing glycosyltransferase [Paenibacillus hamazuiensis]|uniref:GT-D fold domain-containing protein n=1 Tax=Paenibacillus hamazuiensis TaxID=2936508 RepID=UPI00200F3BDE|nr:GT-D fold domain-containing glycosyltransferase [Paenibacillus hamazuiensis]
MKRVRKRKVPTIGKKRRLRKGKRTKKTVRARKKLITNQPFTAQNIDRMLDESYDKGYKAGYGAGALASTDQVSYERGYDDGYKKGLYNGGDGIVDSLLPLDIILPEVPVSEIIAAGIEQFRHRFYTLQTTQEVAEQISSALDAKQPFSLVRLGDGELLTLAQETVLSIDQVRKEGSFLPYAGVNIPDIAARDLLVSAIKQATVVGIPKLRNATYQPLAFQVFRAHGIDYQSLRLTHSLVNYYFSQEGWLSKLLNGRKVLLVGNVGPALAGVMSGHGVRVAGVVAPVDGVRDIPRVMEEIKPRTFDIALVAAGVAAVVISQRIATELGKVAIDFGHLADSLAKRKEPFR